MDIGVEISLYPLHQQFIPPIRDFINRLNADQRLRVVTNSMSTQLFGDYDVVMPMLLRELRVTLADNDKVVFVMKVLGPLTT
jgi:uncharacterized protein YqgV (UPF0045/DUF77 family)